MVKIESGIQTAVKTGTEIIKFTDLKSVNPATPLDTLDRYIVLADKGISILGKVDALFGKAIGMRLLQAQQTEPDVKQIIRTTLPPEIANQQPGQPAPAPVAPPQEININQITDALDMVEKMQPGVTVKQLSELIKNRPEEVKRIIESQIRGKAAGGEKKEEPAPKPKRRRTVKNVE